MKKIPGGSSPEEKLLKVIEGGDQPSTDSVKKRHSILNLEGLKFFRFDIKQVKMKNLNLGLLALALILTIVLTVVFIKKKNTFDQRINFLIAENKKPSAIFFENEQEKPSLEKYMLEIKRNNPFDLIPEASASKKKEVKVSFQLAGIIWSDNPQAIIEDTIAKKTYTLHQGDSLVGGYRVVKISLGEVVIKGKDGEEILR